MSNKVKIEIMARTNKIGSQSKKIVEFDQEDWDDMTGDDRQEVMLQELFDMIDWDWNIV